MPKEKSSISKTGGDKSEKVVLDYLTKQNRPYGVMDIITNLHGAITKAECQRALNTLVDKELVTTKLYGKQAIYVVRQDLIDITPPEEIVVIEQETAKLQNQIAQAKAKNKELTSELHALNCSLTTEQIIGKLDQIANKNKQLAQHLSMLRTGAQLISTEEKQRVAKELERHRRLWSERRRLFKDMFANVTESLPGKPKELLEELDIDTQDPFDINANPRDLVKV
ncbi:hypothetical protein BX616_005552 [Lobosporangium transversale]|uniref:Tat binding protein 1-interacting protein-domain-containing protein n=1 Tax=Lobosporangium transversale TaxID=64571 RepID=A0A1Y2H1C2_9FUNG|nr:Tat binding protein 1-interacting protein-domain-containing protein [Lobosporangium transversale]KAF9915716.1 hypothetical protein BX616_005552 [Lobosporangium transversale]ORZ27801.1 Tat binding protein 1-interacting protein-domain-containing protein [Lobosporangium transversale]|eukprot:XP_021885504.1 Tat binding protein 1-interacting protein-domain-containing protein [Lobosporangium transversale]